MFAVIGAVVFGIVMLVKHRQNVGGFLSGLAVAGLFGLMAIGLIGLVGAAWTSSYEQDETPPTVTHLPLPEFNAHDETHEPQPASVPLAILSHDEGVAIAVDHDSVVGDAPVPVSTSEAMVSTTETASDSASHHTAGDVSYFHDFTTADGNRHQVSAASVVTVHHAPSWILTFLFGLLVIGGMTLFLIKKPSAAVVAASAGGLALLLVGLTFWLYGVRSQQLEVANLTNEQQARLHASRAEALAREREQRPTEVLNYRGEDAKVKEAKPKETTEVATTAPSVDESDRLLTEFTGIAPTGKTLDKVPTWFDAEDVEDRFSQTARFTLTSGRFATIQEGEDQLLRELRPRLARFVRESMQNIVVPVNDISFAEIRNSGIVKMRLHERTYLETDSHREPIYRVSWQVLLTPKVSGQFVQSRIPIQRQWRLYETTAMFAFVTLLLTTWAGYFRLNDATGGRHQLKLRIAAGSLSLLSPVLLMFF